MKATAMLGDCIDEYAQFDKRVEPRDVGEANLRMGNF